jgi:nicotinate-nucleotide pyrophosphorylase (carboxylating)
MLWRCGVTFDLSHPEILNAVERALAEDIGAGDITTTACIPEDLRAEARFIARQDMMVGGVELFDLLFAQAGGEIVKRHNSGDRVVAGDEIARVDGPARLLLTRERVALNFLQRLSGIATLASKFVEAVAGTGVSILDTRKTTPGLRVLEKWRPARAAW